MSENLGIDEVDNAIGNRTSSGSESLGLLGEIVSEISNRNVESIYSTNKLSPKRNKPNEDNQLSNENVNDLSYYKSPNSVCSTTSSNCLHEILKDEKIDLNDDTKKKKKEYEQSSKNALDRTIILPSVSKQKSQRQQNISETDSIATTTTTTTTLTNRQNSDSNLQNEKSDVSSTKGSSNSKSSNSPDVVSSCSSQTSQNKTTPDVLVGKTRVTTKSKNGIIMPPKPSNLLTKAVNFSERKNDFSKTNTKTTTPTKDFGNKTIGGIALNKAASGKINVASLQQKFEQSDVPSGNGTLTKKKSQVGVTLVSAKK